MVNENFRRQQNLGSNIRLKGRPNCSGPTPEYRIFPSIRQNVTETQYKVIAMSSDAPPNKQPLPTPGDVKQNKSAMQADPVQQPISGKGNSIGPQPQSGAPLEPNGAIPTRFAIGSTPNAAKDLSLPTISAHKKALEGAKDIDGVQLIRSNRWLSDAVASPGVASPGIFLSPTNSDNGSQKAPLHIGSHPPPIASLDPNHYRLLVQGSVKLRSKLSRKGTAQSANTTGSMSMDASAAQKGPTKAVKRKVQFSDESGYDLYILRSVTDLDQMPEVPVYATAYLKPDEEKKVQVVQKEQRIPFAAKPCKFRTIFTQPGMLQDFPSKVQSNKVALQFCLVNEEKNQLTGTIRVLNVGFQKKVTVVLTYDHWMNTREIETFYVHYSSDGATDLFKFEVNLPAVGVSGTQIQFIVRYNVEGHVYWDNNSGMNYALLCNGLEPPDHNKQGQTNMLPRKL